MAKKNARNTRGRIVEAAWRLFYQQGYDDTTVDEIIRAIALADVPINALPVSKDVATI